MANDKKKMVEAITAQEVDFAQWYTDICTKAEPVSYTHLEQGQPKPDETPVLFVAVCQDESLPGCNAVSYTHLDVYKRQARRDGAGAERSGNPGCPPDHQRCRFRPGTGADLSLIHISDPDRRD